jgi:hypothetical protein
VKVNETEERQHVNNVSNVTSKVKMCRRENNLMCRIENNLRMREKYQFLKRGGGGLEQ